MGNSDNDSIYKGVIDETHHFPAARVQYHIFVEYKTGDPSTLSGDTQRYTVSAIESVSFPSDTRNAVTENDNTAVIELETLENIASVTLHYDVRGNDNTETHSKKINNVDRRRIEVPIDHGAGRPITDYTILPQFEVRVDTGILSSFSIRSKTGRYTFRPPSKDALIIPVTFEDSSPAAGVDSLETRMQKTEEYYADEGNGEFDLVSQSVINTAESPYFNINKHSNYCCNNGDYDGSKIIQDTKSKLPSGLNLDNYSLNVFVIGAEGQNGLRSTQSAGQRDEILIDSAEGYGTYAHEIGHVPKSVGYGGWLDHYAGRGLGTIADWGLMGSGSLIDGNPSQITARNKEKTFDYYDHKTISANSFSGTYTDTIRYLKSDSSQTSIKYVTNDVNNQNDFGSYIFEARNPPESDLPSQSTSNPRRARGDGINVYVSNLPISSSRFGNTYLSLVRGPTNDTGRVTLEPNSASLLDDINPFNQENDEFLLDPDEGIAITANPASGIAGHELEISKYDYTSIEGMNVYAQLPNINNPNVPPENFNESIEDPHVGLRAKTSRGTVGMKSDGEFVNNVSNATSIMLSLGSKVYVPSELSPTFTFDTSGLENDSRIANESSIKIVSQTVTRDAEGNRIASDFRTRKISPGSSFEPELARMNTTPNDWSAGKLKTREQNSSSLKIRNPGIKPLTNISVTAERRQVPGTVEPGVTSAPPEQWFDIENLSTVAAASNASVGVELTVPGGAKPGKQAFAINVTAEGTETVQSETVNVTVEVLPTVRWRTITEEEYDYDKTLDRRGRTSFRVTVVNDETSNVPLRDAGGRITGNITKFDIDVSRAGGEPGLPPAVGDPLEFIPPGESAGVEFQVRVPKNGVFPGTYDGTFGFDPIVKPQRYRPFPTIDVPSDYVGVTPTAAQQNVSVTAEPVEVRVTDVEFDPSSRVEANETGNATERVRIDPQDPETGVIASDLLVTTGIPDGWRHRLFENGDRARVCIVEELRVFAEGFETQAEEGDSGPVCESRAEPASIEGDLDTQFHDPTDLVPPSEYNFTVVDDERVILEMTELEDIADVGLGEGGGSLREVILEFRIRKPANRTDFEYNATGNASAVGSNGVVDPALRNASDAFPTPNATATPIDVGAPRVPKNSISLVDDRRGERGTIDGIRAVPITDGNETHYWGKINLTGGEPYGKRDVWVPLLIREREANLEVNVTDRGTGRIPAVLTRDAQGSYVSALRDGRRISLEVPLNDSVTDRDTVVLANATVTRLGEDARLEITTKCQETGIALNTTVTSFTEDTIALSDTVTVGAGIFQGDEVFQRGREIPLDVEDVNAEPAIAGDSGPSFTSTAGINATIDAALRATDTVQLRQDALVDSYNSSNGSYIESLESGTDASVLADGNTTVHNTPSIWGDLVVDAFLQLRNDPFVSGSVLYNATAGLDVGSSVNNSTVGPFEPNASVDDPPSIADRVADAVEPPVNLSDRVDAIRRNNTNARTTLIEDGRYVVGRGGGEGGEAGKGGGQGNAGKGGPGKGGDGGKGGPGDGDAGGEASGDRHTLVPGRYYADEIKLGKGDELVLNTSAEPTTHYQIDFVAGEPIEQLGPADSDNFYSRQDRLIRYLHGSSETPVTRRGTSSPASRVQRCIDSQPMEVGDDSVSVTFTVAANCSIETSLVAMEKVGPGFSWDRAHTQELHDHETRNLTAGTYTYTVDLPDSDVGDEIELATNQIQYGRGSEISVVGNGTATIYADGQIHLRHGGGFTAAAANDTTIIAERLKTMKDAAITAEAGALNVSATQAIDLKGSTDATLESDATHVWSAPSLRVFHDSTVDVRGDDVLELYALDRIDVKHSATVRAPDHDASQIRAFCGPDCQLQFMQQSDVTGVVYAPATDGDGQIKVMQQAEIFGAVVAGDVKVHQAGKIHLDEALTPRDRKPTRACPADGDSGSSGSGSDDAGTTSPVTTSDSNEDQNVLDAAISVEPTNVTTETKTTLDASGSSSADGDAIILYEFDVDGDDVYEKEGHSGASVVHQYDQAGEYEVTVKITDEDGDSDTASTSIQVEEEPLLPPTLNLSLGNVSVGEEVTFRAPRADHDRIALYTWRIDGEGGDEVISKNASFTHTFTEPGTYEVLLTVTDETASTDHRTSSVTVTADGSTIQSGLVQALDEDDDGRLEDGEITEGIAHWQNDEPIPRAGSDRLSDDRILDLIQTWRNDTSTTP